MHAFIDRLLTTAEPWHYLGVLAACVLITLPLELLLGARVYRHPLRLLATIAAVAVPFTLLDLAAISAGLWWFSPRHTIGVELFGRIPVEELAFFVVVPLCALLTHGVVRARPWTRLTRTVPTTRAATAHTDGAR